MFRSSYFLFLLSSLILPSAYGAANFYFQWPSNTTQCQAVPITWSMGKPPFKVWIIPVYGQPFFYDISESYYSEANRTGSTEILLQLAAGVNYVVVVSDANGMATGGSSEVQTVLPSNDTDCLTWASSRSASLDFTFTVSGKAEQCQRGFETSWSGGLEYGPYNFTVIAMDQSFNAYDVTLEKGVTSQSDWVLDIAAGSRFIIMMNSAQGYGRGGTSGIYEVAPSNDTSCLDYGPQPTGSWPSTITTGTLDPPTLPVTQSASDFKKHSGISGGGIAGLVIGLLAAFALIGGLLFFLLRRRRRRLHGQSVGKLDKSNIDLGNDDDYNTGASAGGARNRNGSQAMVEPYREVGSFRPPEGHGSISESNSYYNPSDSRESTTGFANLGAVAGAAAGGGSVAHSHSNLASSQAYGNDLESPLIDENNNPGSPGIAGPLPLKSNPSTPMPLEQTPTLPYAQSGQRPATSMTTISSNETSKPSPSRQAFPTFNDNAQPQVGMRVTNPENPENIPTLPPGATHGPGPNGRANAPGPGGGGRRRAEGQGPTFRRHADAGRFQEEIVDLPPLYSEVPRDGPSPPLSPSEQSINQQH